MSDSTVPKQDLSENQQDSLRAQAISMTVLATVFVGLRFFSRWKAGIYWGIDDYLTVVSLVTLYILLVIMLCMVNWGLGIHAEALHYSDIVRVLSGLLAFECVYVTVVAMVKIALLFMYKRAFDIKSLIVQGYILGGIVIAWAVAIIMVCIFQCQPIAKAWNPMLDGTCIDLKGSFIGNAVPNIVTDVLILALPVRYIWKMVPDKTMRLQLCFVFLLGGFVVIASIYRFSTLFKFQPLDTTWTLAIPCAWCIVECAVGIISVCLPTLGPLLSWMSCIPKRGSKNTRTTQTDSSNPASTGGHGDKFSNQARKIYESALRSKLTPNQEGRERLDSKEAAVDAMELGEHRSTTYMDPLTPTKSFTPKTTPRAGQMNSPPRSSAEFDRSDDGRHEHAPWDPIQHSHD